MISLDKVSQRKLQDALSRTEGLELIPAATPEAFYIRSGERVYMVIILGNQAECNCKGGQNGLYCRHLAAAKEFAKTTRRCTACGEFNYRESGSHELCPDCAVIEAEAMAASAVSEADLHFWSEVASENRYLSERREKAQAIAQGLPICGECECLPAVEPDGFCRNCIEREKEDCQDLLDAFRRGEWGFY